MGVDGRMRDVVEQAQLMYEGETEFLHWLQGRVVESGVPTLGEYGPTDVFGRLLGKSIRVYQAWELKKSYPVRDPERKRRHGAVKGRVYSPTQVAQIAWWVWEQGRQEGGESE